ncbi:PREDICTED: uncharacterized protein LOC104727665 [Camelina sativa]|uniref:Uncharacterized protein LOC104727665 n=1 Tax=Camelina sativa TaxID=90675 RepID=A0ABM0URK6_CAMSA|nr:PREDICTED: uncharacterized protein LOC104727665 [Camelina sativa]
MAEASLNRPPPFPPDPPDLNHLVSLSDFPPLSPISPSLSPSLSPSQHSPQTAYIEPERVIVALPVQYKSTLVVVNPQAQAILNTYHQTLKLNPRSAATVATSKVVSQTDGLFTATPPKVARRVISPHSELRTQQVNSKTGHTPGALTVLVLGDAPPTLETVTSYSQTASPVVPNALPPLLPIPLVTAPST